jgi:hypothetical protein
MTQRDLEVTLRGVLEDLKICRADLLTEHKETARLLKLLERIELGDPTMPARELARLARSPQ